MHIKSLYIWVIFFQIFSIFFMNIKYQLDLIMEIIVAHISTFLDLVMADGHQIALER